MKDSHTLLEESTQDILVSVLKEIEIKNIRKEDLQSSEAYVILHRDNPETKEMLGSINIRVPITIDSASKKIINKMNIPTERPMLTCFGVFDASEKNLESLSTRCIIRNEHGYPISYTSESLLTKTKEINKKMVTIIKKEILEDLNNIL